MNIVLSGIRQLRDPYYQGFAAIVAFYLLLSIVPLLILLSQLLGLFSVSLEFLGEWIEKYVKGEGAKVLGSILEYAPSGTMNFFLVVIALWSASRAQFCMMRITNYTLTGGKSTGKGYFKERLRSIKTMIFTVFTVTFSLVILVYGDMLIQMLIYILMHSTNYDAYISSFWLTARWLVALILYFLMVSYNYYVLPSWRVRYRDIVPGSLFAALGMLLATWVFNIYLNNNIANYDLIYGSLGSIVALMFWFYLISWAVGLGVIFNKAWIDTRPVSG